MNRIVILLAVLSSPSILCAQMTVEYVAHACFVIESPSGVRVVLDPYNGNAWLGYSFPRGIEADGVAITHPHYDHDASYYFDETAPVFREPREYRLGDIRLLGVKGEHAGASRFLDRGSTPHNTIWIVEVDGVRLAHLGDNGALTDELMEALGRVDILVARATGTFTDIESVLRRLDVRVVVPNHYRLPSISDLPAVLSTVDAWLGEQRAERLGAHVFRYEFGALPKTTQVHVFAPSPAVRGWPQALHRAWKEVDAAGELSENDPETLAHYRSAVELAPDVMKFRWLLGRSLAAAGRGDEAVGVLEAGLAQIPLDDWTDELRSRALLGRLYADSGHPERAATQYRWVVSQQPTYAAAEWERARQFLDTKTR